MSTYKQHVKEDKISKGVKVFDVEDKLVGTVKKVTKDLITLSNGDRINSDSVYYEDGRWHTEL